MLVVATRRRNPARSASRCSSPLALRHLHHRPRCLRGDALRPARRVSAAGLRRAGRAGARAAARGGWWRATACPSSRTSSSAARWTACRAGALMAAPYGRVVVLHVTIIFGGFAVAGLGRARPRAGAARRTQDRGGSRGAPGGASGDGESEAGACLKCAKALVVQVELVARKNTFTPDWRRGRHRAYRPPHFGPRLHAFTLTMSPRGRRRAAQHTDQSCPIPPTLSLGPAAPAKAAAFADHLQARRAAGARRCAEIYARKACEGKVEAPPRTSRHDDLDRFGRSYTGLRLNAPAYALTRRRHAE